VKNLILSALALVLFACTPSQVVDNFVPQFPPGSSGSRLESGLGWKIELDSSAPGWIIASGQVILALPESTAPCAWQPTSAGERFAIKCNTPNKFTLDTKGQVQALPLENVPIPPKAAP
jgi:hypothetical protein